MLDRDDSPPIPLGPVRWACVWLAWAGVSLASIAWPATLIYGAFAAGLACLWVMAGTLSGLRTLLDRDIPFGPALARRYRVVLAAVAVAAFVGAVGAYTDSMGFRANNGEILYRYGLSRLVAPAAFAAIFGTAVRAYITVSPRRIGVVIALSISTWPSLVAIRVLRVPLFDLDQEHVMVAPWAIYAYLVSVAIIGGCAIGLMIKTFQVAAASPDQQPLPTAELVARR